MSTGHDGTAGHDGPLATERQERLPARGEIDEVAPGVLRAQLPIELPGLGHVNCYVLPDDRGVTLVDPGLPDPVTHDTLVSLLAAAGIPEHRIHTVVVTHSHPDHFGGAGRLKVEQRCDVVAHEMFTTPFDPQPGDPDLAELPLSDATDASTDETTTRLLDSLGDADLPEVDGPYNPRLAALLFGTGPIPDIPARTTPWGGEGFRPGEGELAWMRSWDDMTKRGLLALSPTTRVTDMQWLRLGGRDWQAIWTPGHTGDHLCLFEPEGGTLLSGDHVLPTITPHISGLTPSGDALAEFIAGLRRVASLEGVQTVLPAHGLPFEDLAGRVDEIIEHHAHRLDRLEAITADLGEAGVRAHSHRLFAERSWGPMAESETYAHLEHLRLAGRVVSRRGDDGRLRYRPAG